MNSRRLRSAAGRREDQRLTMGLGQYTDDLQHDGALHVVFIRSNYVSATVLSIDPSAALAHPGVVAVLTGGDMMDDGFDDCPVPFVLAQGDGSNAIETPRPFLIRDRVRFVGEPVAMVIADSYFAAQNGAELVVIDYLEQAAVTEVSAAVKEGAPPVWDDRPGNIGFHWRGGDRAKVDRELAMSHHVARLTSRISRVVASPIEPRSALAYIDHDGRPVLRASHQSPHQLRDELAKLFKLDARDLRVLVGDVGGSFGMKWGALREEILVFWAALHLSRPVRWTASRSESFLADEHARDVLVTSELGVAADGRFTALRVRYDVNLGAYMSQRSISPINNIGGIAGVYMTPAIAADVIGVFTNTQSTCAYRGAGRPDATYAIERVIDVAAMEMSIDPAELCRRNLIPSHAMPYRTNFRFEYDCGDFEVNLDKALELARYDTFANRREDAKRRGRLRGIGIAMPIEAAGSIGSDLATLRAHPDGTVTVTTGTMSVGQGHETGFCRLASERLGIPESSVRYVQGDTDLIADGKGNGGSSGVIMGGSAVIRGADDLIAKGRELAARELEASAADIEFAHGTFTVVGTDRALSLREVAALSLDLPAGAGSHSALTGSGGFAPVRPTFPNGCHICEVEVDPETGEVTPTQYVSVEDIGRVLNPVLVEGQIHGGAAQGIGQVLFEEIRYDENGQLVTGSFMDYPMPRALDVPPFISANIETPTALNPLGVKGVGEAGTVGALSATHNAICHALQAAGIRHLDMPATPHRVWRALRDAGYVVLSDPAP